jgi:hypothetical protein
MVFTKKNFFKIVFYKVLFQNSQVYKVPFQNSQVSISPIFYEQLFHMKVSFCAAFMCLQFGFVIFWQKDFGAKAAHKMLVKLTPGLQSTFSRTPKAQYFNLLFHKRPLVNHDFIKNSQGHY